MRKNWKSYLICILLCAGLALGIRNARAVDLDPELPEYTAVSGVSGTISSVGSDSMNNLMALWAEGFQRFYPNVQVSVEGKGSSTAPVALIAGTAMFGPMSRDMRSSEIDEFAERFGYPPTLLPTSIDMLAVYVHKDNPIAKTGLTLPQVDAMFSSTRLLGYPGDITTWGQVGLTGEWENLTISLYGRNAASGTYGFVKEIVLGKGDYKDAVKEQPGSSSVVQGVASDKAGIGYSGIGYKTADVLTVPLAETADGKKIPAEAEYAYTGDYPLSRYLWLAMNHQPGTELDPLRREFVRFIFSKQGQEAVVRDGYYPVTAKIARETLENVGIAVNF